MKTKHLFITLAAWCMLAAAQTAAQDVETVSGVVTATSRMQYGERTYDVHPMASNLRVSPEQWQFRYPPLLLPEVDKEGKLHVVKQEVGDAWVVSLRIWFDNIEAHKAAFLAVKAGYPGEAAKFQEANVGCIPISGVKFTVIHPKGKLTTDSFNPGGALSYRLNIPAKTEAEAKEIEDWLRGPLGQISCEYQFGTHEMKENSKTVTMQHLRNTRLQQKLDGLPKDDKGMVYVHRDALQQLATRIQSQIAETDWVEDPATFDASIVEGLVGFWNKQIEVDINNWDKKIERSTFDPQDLAPDKIQRDFNKGFTYDSTMKQYKVNAGGSFEGNFGYSIMSMGSKGTATYTREQLENLLRQNGWEVELDGMMIKPKKVWLQVVNTADFAANITISNRRLFVGKKESQTARRDIQPADSTRDKAVQKDLVSRVAELQSSVEALKASPKTGFLNLHTVVYMNFPKPFDAPFLAKGIGGMENPNSVKPIEIDYDIAKHLPPHQQVSKILACAVMPRGFPGGVNGVGAFRRLECDASQGTHLKITLASTNLKTRGSVPVQIIVIYEYTTK